MTQGERRERLTERPLRVFEAATSFAVGPVGSGELAPEVCALDRCVPALLPQPPMNVPRPRQCQPAHLGDRLKQQLHLYLIALAEADKRMSASSPLPSSARKEGRSPRLSMTRCLHRAAHPRQDDSTTDGRAAAFAHLLHARCALPTEGSRPDPIGLAVSRQVVHEPFDRVPA